MVNENGEQLWRTADGTEIPFSEVTHQHWSNIYWYHRYIYEITCEGLKEKGYGVLSDFAEKTYDKCKYLMDFSFGEIQKRFDGCLCFIKRGKAQFVAKSFHKLLKILMTQNAVDRKDFT